MTQDAKVTRLAEGTVVRGEVSFPGGKLRIEGEVYGNISAVESVEIVHKGKVVGDIVGANEIELLGKVEGNIKTKKLMIRPSGVLTGNLEVEHFVMEEGGKILGEVKMNLGDTKEAWKTPAAPKTQPEPAAVKS